MNNSPVFNINDSRSTERARALEIKNDIICHLLQKFNTSYQRNNKYESYQSFTFLWNYKKAYLKGHEYGH